MGKGEGKKNTSDDAGNVSRSKDVYENKENMTTGVECADKSESTLEELDTTKELGNGVTKKSTSKEQLTSDVTYNLSESDVKQELDNDDGSEVVCEGPVNDDGVLKNAVFGKTNFYRVRIIDCERKGICPDSFENINNEVYQLSNLKCCLVEHSYFKARMSLKPPPKITSNEVPVPSSETTLPFANALEQNENRKEKQTIEVKDSTTKHDDPDTLNPLNKNGSSIKYRLRKRTVNRTYDSEVGFTNEKRRNSAIDLQSETRRSSKRFSNGCAADGRRSAPHQTKSTRHKGTSVNSVRGASRTLNNSTNISKSVKPLAKIDDKLNTDEPVSLDEIAKEITEMEKIIQSKCDILCDNIKSNSESKSGDILPSKMKNIVSKDDASDSQRDGDYVLPVPNSTKMVSEGKNWNLKYTEDDVKNLGLDDLLLRASELNAENFTKALGQNAARNGGKSDSPDIVLTFPNSRTGSTDDATKRESDVAKSGNGKKTKMDFMKKYTKDDKSGKTSEEDVSKKVPEAPKRLGIKVKTVQNINEEFKDSLGAKMKTLDGRDIGLESPVPPKPVFTIPDDAPSVQVSKETNTPLLSCRPNKVVKPLDQSRSAPEVSEETRPFIMSVLPTKDGAVREHMPSVLTGPQIFAIPKPNTSENGPFLPQLEERRNASVNNKKVTEGGDTRNVNENVTLVVSDPRAARPFEVVNVDNFVSDGGAVKKAAGLPPSYVVHYRNGSFSKESDIKILKQQTVETGPLIACRKRNIPFVLNHAKKYLSPSFGFRRLAPAPPEKTVAPTWEDPNKRVNSRPVNRIIKPSSEGGAIATASQIDKPVSGSDKGPLAITSTEKRLLPNGKFVKLTSPDQAKKGTTSAPESVKHDEEKCLAGENGERERCGCPNQVISLTAFTSILKDILPDKWVISLDKKYGLQIIKTHLDKLLNPSIMISVVVGRTGKVTVNVRGRQLEKSHDLFSNLCDVGNSEEKISINYILALINKLRFFNVCFGCNDLSLKKYWSEDGFIEYYTEFQQTYRSHICESLVRLGRKRCYPCYRMHESLKKRKRREQILKKTDADTDKSRDSGNGKGVAEKENSAVSNSGPLNNGNPVATVNRGVKRNLEEFLEESFMTMKQKIVDEIERTREEEESEKVPKTQDEVLGFMGLTRKDTLDVNLRKSKRERKGFKKQCESFIGTSVNKEELYFLEKYWEDINVLFSTSLLVGAYSRTGSGRLREKCRKFHKLLSTWRGIARDNPDWMGGYMNLAENLVDDDSLNEVSLKEKFDSMDYAALRVYIINCVKEVNKIKSRLRTKNAYFKVLYNTFVKPRLKKVRMAESEASLCDDERGDAGADVAGTAERQDEEGAVIKPSDTFGKATVEVDSSDEKDEDSQNSNGLPTYVSDGD